MAMETIAQQNLSADGLVRNIAPDSPVSEYDFAPGLEAAFPEHFPECEEVLSAANGAVPDFVRGTYYLNGPARFGRNGMAYRHWLDGDGLVCALRFDDQAIQLKTRYVRSRKLVQEESAGRPLFRAFGTAFDSDRLNQLGNGLESPVNVSVYPFGKSLLAFGEQGLPWELDPDTLETRGQFTFNGRLNEASPFSAHPKFDANTGEMFNFGVFFSAGTPRLYLYCFDARGLRYRKSVPLDYPCSVHDFSLSKNHVAFYLSPYLLNIGGLLKERRTVMESLSWEPGRGSRLVILARGTGEMVASIPVGHRYCLHLIHSFEEEGRLTVDVLEFDRPLYDQYQPVPGLFTDAPRGGPVRLVIDLAARDLAERRELPYLQCPDFPAIDPGHAMQANHEFWMLGISHTGKPGRKFFDQLAHGDWRQPVLEDIYQSPPLKYLGGEPVFVGNISQPEEGVVICQEFDARGQTSHFLLFDARRVANGPFCKISTASGLYFGFHAMFQKAGHKKPRADGPKIAM